MILVDTNVLLDVVEDDPTWADWSQRQLDAASLRGPICINPVIYAELSMAFARIEELEPVVADGGLEIEEIPREALFLAGKVFLRYRQRSRSAPEAKCAAGFLHRRARGSAWHADPDAGRRAVSDVFSDGRADQSKGLMFTLLPQSRSMCGRLGVRHRGCRRVTRLVQGRRERLAHRLGLRVEIPPVALKHHLVA